MSESFMEGFRALDLTNEKGFLCGKILSDIGVDVIKIESPFGDPSRLVGPFYHNESDPQKSLYWFAYNANKRGITLDIECAEGKKIFSRLVDDADFVIESFPPGYLEELGLGYHELSKLNKKIILTSISGFGQDGPYQNYKATDIVVMAMGGMMSVSGEPNRPPITFSLPLGYLHAASEAAVGTMIAHYYREVSGLGQWVDQSATQSVVGTLHNVFQTWDLVGKNLVRSGANYRLRPPPSEGVQAIWPCKDGYVSFVLLGADLGFRINTPLVQWMDEEGMCPQELKRVNWRELDATEISGPILALTSQALTRFFMAHTKQELYEGALKWRTLIYPVSDPKDIVDNMQLASRDFWVRLKHLEIGDPISYPGAFVKTSETPLNIKRSAPSIGQHNSEIYEAELGFSKNRLNYLKKRCVI